MPRSFLLTSETLGKVHVDELHVNLWFFKSNSAFFDVGLLIHLQKDLFEQALPLRFTCYVPFSIKKESVNDLYNNLKEGEILQLLFNDDFIRKTNIGSFPDIAYAVDFRTRRPLLMLQVDIKPEGAGDKHKLDLTIHLEEIDKERRETLIQDLGGRSHIQIYVRFRYQIDVKSTANVYLNKGAFHSNVHFDFRFNEPRLLLGNKSEIFHHMIRIKTILVFIVQPIYYRIRLDASGNMRYVRMLEEGWVGYMPKLANEKDKYLVYHWKTELPDSAPISNNHFDMLISFEAELRDIMKRLNVALSLALISTIFLLLPRYLDMGSIIGVVGQVLDVASQVLGGIGFTIVLGVLSNALWSVIQQRRSGQNG